LECLSNFKSITSTSVSQGVLIFKRTTSVGIIRCVITYTGVISKFKSITSTSGSLKDFQNRPGKQRQLRLSV
jgi:hypothetical protein